MQSGTEIIRAVVQTHRQVPSKRSPPPAAPPVRHLLKPVVEPVLARLDRHERLLQEMKAAIDVQFKRTADIQAQLDILIATVSKNHR